MKIKLLTVAMYFLAGVAVAVGTAGGASASGGDRARFLIVPPAVPQVVPSASSASSSSSSSQKITNKKKEKIEAAISFYKAGSFDKAVPLFQQVLLVEPTNAQAHYYYANCLAREGQHEAARFEYQSSLGYSKNSDLTNYCNQALKNLDGLSSQKVVSKPLDADSTTPKAAHFDQQLERLRAEVNKEYHHKLDEKKTELNRKISKIELERDEEINSTPKYFPAHISSQNINYKSTIDGIKTKAEYKIRILTSDYQEDFRLIDEAYGKRLDALASSHQNLKGQMGATVGSSQVTPAGTSFYVRNYVNFGGVQEESTSSVPAFSPGLRAVPGRLKPFASQGSRGRL